MGEKTFQEHCNICVNPEVLNRIEEKWWGVFNRPISLRISYFLARYTKITPNQVTALNMIVPLGGFLIVLPGYWGIAFYIAVFEIWAVLDCVDGELARSTNKTSQYGPYLDSIGHYISYVGLFIPIALKAYLETDQVLILIMGFVLAILVILASVAQQMKTVILYKTKIFKNVLSEKTDSLVLKAYRFLVGTLEVAVIVTIILLLSMNASSLVREIIWLGFFSVYIALFLISFFYHIIKAKDQLKD
ncbi:MAG: Bifunctional IPC transferase and DIPP synthase [candidate division WS2 bacterium ADurb.Bin280]|uniref:Bifunctional IPC transferase and DIPP synthase n=1 Tax=candidate division WS2 bacterium ADurb.Bin280 TaxID=1852829 RepID=A0A1V5SBC6_9BACT|nr:MAG: Bifunctional IPC transferase and DIPP synthase [candidate division WS2 bacterium ADurb.Bin280]